MVAQLDIFGGSKLIDFNRYTPPDYAKFYTIYQYDRENFKKELRSEIEKRQADYSTKIKNEDEFLKIQNAILEKWFLKDEQGLKLRDSDEVHIFRIKTLHKIHELIFSYTGIMPINSPYYYEGLKVIKKDGLLIYPKESQAEIEGTWQGSIKERLKIHIKLLRLLRGGFSVRESILKLKGV